MTPALDPVLRSVLRLALALLFASAAAHKLRDPAGFRSALADYRILPQAWTQGAAALLAALELGLALALLASPTASAPLAAAALLCLYTGAIALNLWRGRGHIDCGCAGPARGHPLSGALIARNAVLCLAALLCAAPVRERALVGLDIVSIAAGVSLLALLHASAEVALANAAQLRALRGRP